MSEERITEEQRVKLIEQRANKLAELAMHAVKPVDTAGEAVSLAKDVLEQAYWFAVMDLSHLGSKAADEMEWRLSKEIERLRIRLLDQPSPRDRLGWMVKGAGSKSDRIERAINILNSMIEKSEEDYIESMPDLKARGPNALSPEDIKLSFEDWRSMLTDAVTFINDGDLSSPDAIVHLRNVVDHSEIFPNVEAALAELWKIEGSL